MREMESLALPYYSQINRSKENVKLTRSTSNSYPPSKEVNLFAQLAVYLSLLWLLTKILQVISLYESKVAKETKELELTLTNMKNFASTFEQKMELLFSLVPENEEE